MNWYKIILAVSKQEYLSSLGADKNIINFILSQPENKSQKLINEFRKNPSFVLNELKTLKIKDDSEQQSVLESALITRYPQGMQKWVLVVVRKEWKNNVITKWNRLSWFTDTSDTGKNANEVDLQKAYDNFVKGVYGSTNSVGRKLSEIVDWYSRSGRKIDIASYTFEQAIVQSDKWHKEMAEKGKEYEPTKQENIVYGPQWIDKDTGKPIPQYQGWTIQTVTSKNDLLAEGHKMNHCVGSYFSEVATGEAIIYSLRDPSNEPHVTIESDGEGTDARQIQGKSNSNPKPEYIAMIKNWIVNDQTILKHNNNSFVYSHDIEVGDIDTLAASLTKNMVEDEYGLRPSLQLGSFNKILNHLFYYVVNDNADNDYGIFNILINHIFRSGRMNWLELHEFIEQAIYNDPNLDNRIIRNGIKKLSNRYKQYNSLMSLSDLLKENKPFTPYELSSRIPLIEQIEAS